MESVWVQLSELYASELPLSTSSAFITHGASTWGVLLCGWLSFCFLIDLFAENVEYIRRSKIQSYEKTADPKLRALARETVTRNWLFVLVQTIAWAPFLKLAFPLWKNETNKAISLLDFVSFYAISLVSADFLFTVFHTLFHEIPWLYKFAHKEHHTWKSPYVWMSHAMSFTELAANGISVMAYPLFHSVVLSKTTSLEMVWSIQLIAQLIGCIEHSGYAALNPLVIINADQFPSWLFTTTKHHDDHHKYFQGNYGGYLAIWDYLMGTELQISKRPINKIS